VSSNRVVIFSKSADLGTVKTRLRKVLTDEQCLSLHIALLKDTLLKVQNHGPVLYLSGSGFLPFEPGVLLFMQTGTNLGERLSNAFEKELKTHNKVLVIGTDSPTFPEEQIGKALLALDHHDPDFRNIHRSQLGIFYSIRGNTGKAWWSFLSASGTIF
jgi:glycosyltransferase A (GT-A) superfamily protein (DUF2064 family)